MIGKSNGFVEKGWVRSQKTKSKIELLFSYSEWWRYIGSVKPRQPPADWSAWEGASLSEIFEQ